mgnify:CR=1 FL=1
MGGCGTVWSDVVAWVGGRRREVWSGLVVVASAAVMCVVIIRGDVIILKLYFN